MEERRAGVTEWETEGGRAKGGEGGRLRESRHPAGSRPKHQQADPPAAFRERSIELSLSSCSLPAQSSRPQKSTSPSPPYPARPARQQRYKLRTLSSVPFHADDFDAAQSGRREKKLHHSRTFHPIPPSPRDLDVPSPHTPYTHVPTLSTSSHATAKHRL